MNKEQNEQCCKEFEEWFIKSAKAPIDPWHQSFAWQVWQAAWQSRHNEPTMPNQGQETAEEIKRLKAVIERDRSKVSDVWGLIQKVMERRAFILEGRGPYEWDDDEYRKEYGRALKDINKALEPLHKLLTDLTDCPETQAEVIAARIEPENEALIRRIDYVINKYKPEELAVVSCYRLLHDCKAALSTQPAKTEVDSIEAEVEAVGEAIHSAELGKSINWDCDNVFERTKNDYRNIAKAAISAMQATRNTDADKLKVAVQALEHYQHSEEYVSGTMQCDCVTIDEGTIAKTALETIKENG